MQLQVAVDVRMKAQLLVPGVEHGGKEAGHGSQTFGRGQLFRERPGDRGKEKVVGLPGVGAIEALPQLGREREGDQEIGSLDELVELTLDPAGRGGAAALRTGLMGRSVVRCAESFWRSTCSLRSEGWRCQLRCLTRGNGCGRLEG